MGQQVLNGIFLGSIYALFAVGYTLVFGVLDILNLAHQAVFMLAAFIALALVADAHLSLWVAMPAAVLAAGVIGIVLERLAFRPLRGRADSNISGLILWMLLKQQKTKPSLGKPISSRLGAWDDVTRVRSVTR